MYAKFVIDDKNYKYCNRNVSNRIGNRAKGTQVPSRKEEIFEGEHFSYQKIKFNGVDEFKEWFRDFKNPSPLTLLPEKDEQFCGIEIILLKIYREGLCKQSVFVAANASLFIMNDAGDTIDRLVVKNN